ncbi:MAG: hypothetical protein M3135_09010 [Actinomycetota bacterium]|nr:hypothetical protein [Actinomycetota bacterium]
MRTRLPVVVVTVGVALIGCGRLGPEATPEDVLFLRSGGGVTLVRDLPEGVAVNLRGAVPSTDWSAVARAVPNSPQTRIEVLDPLTGAELWSRNVPVDDLEVKVAARNGSIVALGSRGGSAGYPRGRSATTLVILREDTPQPRTIELEGNYEPEAFSADGESLFVVEYLPPERPTRYQVRRLDLLTEEVVGVYTPDAHLQEAMQGTARIQAASRDGRRLYTLYTLVTRGTTRAFVHVLSLDELWAHCIDLPSNFATARESAVALSLTPEGNHLYVVDASTGTIADIDTEALAVSRTTEAELGGGGGPANAVVAPGGDLYVARGARFLALDTDTMATGQTWDMQARITGLQAANDGGRLYVGLRDRIEIIDTATGEGLGSLDPENLEDIEQLGQSTRLLEEERTAIECAC